jgi:hypothetical protein
MILARRSSPAPSARHICRTKTKKTKSLTCLRHPLPSAGRGTKPRRGGIFGPCGRPPAAASPENSPAFQGWGSLPAIFPSPGRDERTLLPSLTGLLYLVDASPSHKWLGYCHCVLRATKNSNANCPKCAAPERSLKPFVPVTANMPARRAGKIRQIVKKLARRLTRVVWSLNNGRRGQRFRAENGIKNPRVVIFNRWVVPKHPAVVLKHPADGS